MDFASPLLRAKFIRREKRFFVFAELDGAEVVAHCPNTGSLKGVLERTTHVWLLEKSGAGKLKYSTEIAELEDGTLVGIHPVRANTLAEEAVRGGFLDRWIGGFTGLRREVVCGDTGCRFDLHVDVAGLPWWLEVKSASMALPGGVAAFPDSVSERGAKHLRTLVDIAKHTGAGVGQVFIIQRGDCERFAPASHIDPVYAETLKLAMSQGVQVAALACRVTPQGIYVSHELPVMI